MHLNKWRDQGHFGSLGNNAADDLASQGTQMEPDPDIDLTVPQNWNITGVKAGALSQAMAYAGICLANPTAPQTATEIALDRTYHCVHNHLTHYKWPWNVHESGPYAKIFGTKKPQQSRGQANTLATS
ncbi:hypothetical protein BC835DRAFT_1303638 [Cytidiella melzeri]|nr:hypothetical protein BC835DRAFT_1303638 [Cytidiella melzeri]